jgi:hypothetical protein
MEILGLFLFFSVVLYLIDKNQAWPKFWGIVKFVAIVGVVSAASFAGYSYWSERRKAASQIDFSKYENKPVTITPDSKPVTLDMSTAQPIQRVAVDCYDSKGHFVHDRHDGFAEKFGGVTTGCAPGEIARVRPAPLPTLPSGYTLDGAAPAQPVQALTPDEFMAKQLKPWEEACIKQARAKYPGAYADRSDAVLMEAIHAKYGDTCPVK